MENNNEVAVTEEKPKKILLTNTFLESLLCDSDELPSLEEQIIAACKEINLMRKGLLPEIDAREAIAQLREELKDELAEDTEE